MQLARSGITVDLPTGWDGAIGRSAQLTPQAAGDLVEPTVAHFANFSLPPSRADFGADVTEKMRPGDVLVVLFEYGAESAGKALFGTQGVPRIGPGDFDRNALQRGVAGQSGLQRFFSVGNRPFCLYVVVGSHIDRADAVPAVNALLESLVIE